MDGLFTAAEMKSDSFKDKESKVNYIQKVIDVMGKFAHHLLHLMVGGAVVYVAENAFLTRVALHVIEHKQTHAFTS